MHELEQLGLKWIARAWCRRGEYALALDLGGARCLQLFVDEGGARARLDATAPADEQAWTTLTEASEQPWYRQDLGLTTLRVAIEQGVTLESVQLETARPGDAQVKLRFAGARTFLLYGDATVDEAGRLRPRLRSRWEELA